MSKIIIGLGSGRCGTVSLSKLLDIEHEPRPLLPWIYSERLFKKNLHWIKEGEGAVASYYLHYVKRLIEEFGDDVGFVCLKRSQEETVESFIRKTQGQNIWRDNINEWSDIFPSYDLYIWDAIYQYWEDYYKKAEEYKKLYLGQFRIYDIEALKYPDTQKNLLEFCEMEKSYMKNCHYNKSNFYAK